MKGYLIVLHSSTTSGSTGQPVAYGNSSSSQSPLWTTESSQSTTLASGSVMILEDASKKQKHVCRSTFAAELFAAVDGIDAALHIATSLFELVAGPQTLNAM